MKKNMRAVMERLEVDEGIKPLIRQLWKHRYRTISSCEGHLGEAFVMMGDGDGWFESNAEKYGFHKRTNRECCAYRHQLDNCCGRCGAGINGKEVYAGTLVKKDSETK